MQIVRGGSSGNQQAATPLTATLEDVPATHDGSSAFTFRIAFSAEVTIASLDMRDHALTVAGGTVTTAERVDGRTDLWEITVEPSGSGAVSILVPQGRACTETGALCTADGRMLSTGLGQSVPFAAPEAQGQQAETPLTAAFENLPASHDGTSAFTFGLTFSEDVAGLSFRTLRDEAFDVTGGDVRKARRRTTGSNQEWDVTVEPDSSGAICTSDGRELSNSLSATVAGPVGISVADA